MKRNWTKLTIVSMAFCLFWGAWYSIAGQIPSTQRISIFSEETAGWAWSLTLPFAISRLWDPIAAPLFVWLIISNIKLAERKKPPYAPETRLLSSLIVLLISGAAIGLMELTGQLGPALLYSLLYGLILWLFFLLGGDPIIGMILVFNIFIGTSIMTGILVGMPIGLAVFVGYLIVAVTGWLVWRIGRGIVRAVTFPPSD